MAMQCKKCWQWKMTPDQKCWCSKVKFDDWSRLVKKKKPKPIPQVSEKRKAVNKARWRFDVFFQKVAKKKVNDKGDWVCEYCKTKFNLQYDVINQTVCFAHILSKWDPHFVHLAMFFNNIAFVCSEKCHKEMDSEICVLWLKPELKKRIEAWDQIDVWDLNQYIT